MKKLFLKLKSIKSAYYIAGIIFIVVSSVGISLAYSGYNFWNNGGKESVSAIFSTPTQTSSNSPASTVTEAKASSVPSTSTATSQSNDVKTSNNKQVSSTDSNNKSYTPSNCITTDIPYETEYRDDPNLEIGKTEIHRFGQKGWEIHCTASSTGYMPPKDGSVQHSTNEIIYRGTKYVPSAEEIRNEKIQQCIQNMKLTSPNSNAWQQCYTMY